MSARSTIEVFEDHLALRQQGDLEADLRRNYAEAVVLLTSFGILHGHEGVRRAMHRLGQSLPKPSYQYRTRLVDGEMAFVEWTADSVVARVHDGADTFLIRHGHIQVQTMHYSLRPKPER